MGQLLDRLLYPQRIDRKGDIVHKGLRTRLYQAVFERGWSVPWIYSAARCAKFWNIPAGLTDASNRPEDYAYGPVGIMPTVLRYIAPCVSHDASILEFGCNAGSKLEAFRKAGYTKLSGLELNAACFDVMRSAFPELHRMATLHTGTADQVLSSIETGRFDLVYSISSIQHVHPSHHHVFDEIARICRGYLLTVEIEWAGGPYYFPRNYRRVFEARGFSQKEAVLISREVCPEPELNAYWGHIMRLFVKNDRAATIS